MRQVGAKNKSQYKKKIVIKFQEMIKKNIQENYYYVANKFQCTKWNRINSIPYKINN